MVLGLSSRAYRTWAESGSVRSFPDTTIQTSTFDSLILDSTIRFTSDLSSSSYAKVPTTLVCPTSLVVHPPGRGNPIAGHVHNSAGSVGIYSLRGAGSYVVALAFGSSTPLLWQTERGKFSTDGNPVDTTGESYFTGARPTFRILQQSPP